MNKTLKCFIFTALILCNLGKLTAQTVIKGTLVGKNDTTLFVSYADDKGLKNETLKVKNGVFEWNKPIAFPTHVTFSFSKRQSLDDKVATIWTEPGTMQLTLNANKLNEYKLSGSKLDAEVKLFEKETQIDKDRLMALMKKASEESSTVDMGVLRNEATEIYRQIATKNMKYLENNPTSYYSAYLLDESQQGLSSDSTIHYLGLLKGDAINSPYAKKLSMVKKGEIDGSAGSKAPLFTAKDINGKTFDMSELVGKKYIILDFWASWCVPCRKSNPHLKELYEKYKDKGLVVVCVASDDDSEGAWRKAVANDGIEQFIHVLDGWRGMEYSFDCQNIGTKYGIHTIPTKFLIDKDGVIINRYGEEGEPHSMIDTALVKIFGF